MTILAIRLIEYLKNDSTLTSLLGSANNIFIESSSLRKSSYVTVSTSVGEDQNNIPADIGMISVCSVYNRKSANAELNCIAIAQRLDYLLNKQEHNITEYSYKVINFCRNDSTGLQIDSSSDEYFYRIDYSYIVDETS